MAASRPACVPEQGMFTIFLPRSPAVAHLLPLQKLDASSKNQIRAFGHVQLCGSLYVCWQTHDAVQGEYLVCLLYRDVLCLASAGKVDPIYTIVACISLSGVRVEEVDNGKGL